MNILIARLGCVKCINGLNNCNFCLQKNLILVIVKLFLSTVILQSACFISCCSSGVKAMDKKDGGGARNWGSYKDDFE